MAGFKDAGFHLNRTNDGGGRLFRRNGRIFGRIFVIGRHTHPGPDAGYLPEGEFVLIEGQSPKPLKAGESYQVPSGAIHDATSGAGGAKILAVYIVHKGEPLASPAKQRNEFEVWA